MHGWVTVSMAPKNDAGVASYRTGLGETGSACLGREVEW